MRMRTLLVGVGTRGKTWARLLHDEPLVEVVGYVDPDAHALDWLTAHYDVAADVFFPDLITGLDATQPDLVVLATPPMDRYEEAVAVFAHGAHLLSEKPLTLDFAEGIRIVEAAEAAGRGFVVGLNFRYQHCVTKAQEILRSGEIGAPSFAQYTYWRNRDGKRPGINKFPLTMRQPMLYEQTIHHLDEIRFVYDAEVERVTCHCHNPPWSMYRDDATVVATLEMTGGLLVNYFGTWSGQTQANQFLWRTDCADGSLFQYDLFADLRITRGRATAAITPIPLPPQEPLVDDARLMLTHVVQQLLAGELHPVPSGIDHLKTFGLIAACEESHETGRPVTMADFYARHHVPTHWLTPLMHEGGKTR